MSSVSDKPEQYKKGWVEFFKLKFKVTPDVLIPRPETELLVEEVLKRVRREAESGKKRIAVFDVGTGSGNIAISIAKNLASHMACGSTKIIATDVSKEALKIAKENAKFHGVEDQIEFLESDLLSGIHPFGFAQGKPGGVNLEFDVVVTNLPYIPDYRLPYLDKSVTDFEPHVALKGGSDGFDLYRKLFGQIKEKNIKFGMLIGEIDYTHGETAEIEAIKHFPDAKIEIKFDLAHKQRILVIDWSTQEA